jgi:hypothetical protein
MSYGSSGRSFTQNAATHLLNQSIDEQQRRSCGFYYFFEATYNFSLFYRFNFYYS